MSVKTRRTCPLFLLVAVVAMLPSAAIAESIRAGVVTTLEGTATVTRAALSEPAPLRFKDDVLVNDRITTHERSFARILLGGKALVTVRERSALTITEVPGTSTIDLGLGRIAVAVTKEKMRPGESIAIRTPNGIAAVRGTVVIAEVVRLRTRLGGTPVFRSTITVLRGLVELTPLDQGSGRPVGSPMNVGSLESVRLSDSITPRPRTLTPEAAERVADDFKVTVKGVHQPESAAIMKE